MIENKKPWFLIDLKISTKNSVYQEQLRDAVDLVLGSMSIKGEPYIFKKIDKSRLIYFFQTFKRKRKGQLNKFCERFIPKEQTYTIEGLTNTEVERNVERIKESKDFLLEEMPGKNDVYSLGSYTGKDLEIFKKRSNWHEWQERIYSMLFNRDGSIKEPNQRYIINLVDLKGKSGKSTFFKWLLLKHEDNVGRIGYGSASQLRSNLVNIGPKEIYIIDLSRAQPKDQSQEDLLSVVEDLKSRPCFS